MVDNEGGVTGRFNYGWSRKNTTKMSVQVRPVVLTVFLSLCHC